jgi:hypothetical protein
MCTVALTPSSIRLRMNRAIALCRGSGDRPQHERPRRRRRRAVGRCPLWLGALAISSIFLLFAAAPRRGTEQEEEEANERTNGGRKEGQDRTGRALRIGPPPAASAFSPGGRRGGSLPPCGCGAVSFAVAAARCRAALRCPCSDRARGVWSWGRTGGEERVSRSLSVSGPNRTLGYL